jgi:hypothetical protein
VVLIIALLITGRWAIALRVSPHSLTTEAENSEINVAVVKKIPRERVSLGQLISNAHDEVVFFGISAKRSVTDDKFRRTLEQLSNPKIRIRFLLLDPVCAAFDERAQEEGEPSEAWRSDLQTTTTRLSAYKHRMNLDIQLRFFSVYPIWRAIIVDRKQVYVSVFLPGKRGTEAFQYHLSVENEELAYGLIKTYHTIWEQSREVSL